MTGLEGGRELAAVAEALRALHYGAVPRPRRAA